MPIDSIAVVNILAKANEEAYLQAIKWIQFQFIRSIFRTIFYENLIM